MSEKKKKVPPRITPDRDARYMGLAWFIASFSKDPSTQVGALLINPTTNRPLGWGYNGPPQAIPDDAFSWERPGKNEWVIHAEDNALEHSSGDLKGTTLYVTGLPCKRCMLLLARKKIKRVVYFKYKSDPGSILSDDTQIQIALEIAEQAKIRLCEFDGNLGWVEDWVTQLHMNQIFAF